MQGDSSAGATWTSTRTLTQEQQEVSFHENNIGCKMTREEDSFLPFPCQVKHKNYWGEKQGEAPLAIISRQQGTERERFLLDSSWLTWMVSNTPSSAKALTCCLFISHTMEFHTWESFLQISKR